MRLDSARINDRRSMPVFSPFVDGKVTDNAIKTGNGEIDVLGVCGTAAANPSVLNRVFGTVCELDEAGLNER